MQLGTAILIVLVIGFYLAIGRGVYALFAPHIPDILAVVVGMTVWVCGSALTLIWFDDIDGDPR